MVEDNSRLRLTDKKRRSIVNAAILEFQDHGFDGTSMDRIAKRAEVSKRTVYNHFASKDELFEAIVEELLRRFETLEHRYEQGESLDRQLTRIGRKVLGVLCSDEFIKLARVILSRFLHDPELGRKRMGESDVIKESVKNWIVAAKKDRQLSVTDPARGATQFLSLLKAFGFWPQLTGGAPILSKREQNAVVKSAVSLFLAYYSNG